MQNTTNNNDIISLIIAVQNTRGVNRQKNLINLSEKIYLNFQQRQLITFSRDTLNAVLSSEDLNARTMRKIASEILNYLLINRKIKKDEIKQVSHAFRVKPLVTFDYGSYSVLMSQNGYKPYSINDGYAEEYAEHLNNLTGRYGNKTRLFKNSYKPRSKQAVYSGSNVSIARDKIIYYREVYTLI